MPSILDYIKDSVTTYIRKNLSTPVRFSRQEIDIYEEFQKRRKLQIVQELLSGKEVMCDVMQKDLYCYGNVDYLKTVIDILNELWDTDDMRIGTVNVYIGEDGQLEMKFWSRLNFKQAIEKGL